MILPEEQQEVLKELEGVGAIIADSHIVYTSGKHGSAYINKDAVYPHTKLVEWLSTMMAGEFFSVWRSDRIETVVGPAIGGIILSQLVAAALTRMQQRKQVFGVYAEKDGEAMRIGRGYEKFITFKRVLVVEDVLNTGGSAKKVVDAVRALKGTVAGVAALCNRGGVTEKELGDVPKLIALANVNLDAWDEKDCLLCKAGVPINTQVGKGKEYLAKKAK